MIRRILYAHRERARQRQPGLVTLLGMMTVTFLLSACEVNEEAVQAGAPSGGNPGGGGSPPPPTPPPPSEPPPSSTDQQIFAATLHPELTDVANNCAGCHGATQDPLFAVADVTTAYNAITSQQKVNLSNPALSRIYVRPKNERHNCGGDAECDRIAADFLAAIQNWANQAMSSVPPTGPQAVQSAAANFNDVTAAGIPRIDDATIAHFDFEEGTGNTAMDTSGVGDPITLQLEGTEWVDGGGLQIVSGKAQASLEDSRKLFDMIVPQNAYTVEAWIIPENDNQDGPARIVSYSLDTAVRNFTLGQNAIYYLLRNRSAATGANGTPELEADQSPIELALTHLVATYDGVTGRKLYINGQLAIEEDVPNDVLAWTDDNLLVLGNEATNNRIWQGILRMVAIHNRALGAVEVQQNFDAGAGEVLTMRFDISDSIGAEAYIDMLVSQVDANGYLFARPIYVSNATGIAVKNIRVGINGSVPVAVQPYRRVDTVVMQSGEMLSPLGAIIPVELGIDNDQFHLEFEQLGVLQGLAEAPVPSSPPLPVADSPDSEYGIRNFSQLNDTMSELTGVDPNESAVLATYAEIRDSLPPTSDLLSFGPTQQIAIQRLAASYCGAVVNNGARCDGFFGNCAVDGNNKDQVADSLYDRLIGDNIALQPQRADVTSEVVRMIDDLGCANGCNGAEGELVLQATCAAVLSSAAVTVN